jgi:hypothetical protein
MHFLTIFWNDSLNTGAIVYPLHIDAGRKRYNAVKTKLLGLRLSLVR